MLEVAAPGLLVVKHHSGEEAGKFVNVVLLEGDLIKVIDEYASNEYRSVRNCFPHSWVLPCPPPGRIPSTFWSASPFRCVSTGAVDACW